MSNRGRLLSWSLGVIAFTFFFLFGALAVDPFPAYRAVMEEWLAISGGHREVFAADDGSRLSVWVLGPLSAERPVVLLHGLGADASYWAGAARVLVRAGRTVLLPDGPGSGRSEPPRGAAGYRVPGRVAALDALFRALALEKADLVGHSLGGWTVAAFALRHPEKTGRLVLVDAGGFELPADVAAERRRVLPEDRPGARRVLDLLFFRRPFPAAGFVVNAFGRNYGGDPAAVTVRSLEVSDGLEGRAKDLPAGTAVIWGEKETLFPLPLGKKLAAEIPGGRLFVLPGAGHDGPLETPRAFREALALALTSTPQSGDSR
ncbi:MAG TPA: alpha/beta hydrolase [Thermoanaerobaculia bacterium]|jgi:pimeloyl-ACP methyl ester carboxylesterase